MFAADGAVPESSQSGTPQGEGESKPCFLNPTISVQCDFVLFVVKHCIEWARSLSKV